MNPQQIFRRCSLICAILSLCITTGAASDIYALAADKDITKLREVLAANPLAWQTDDDYLSDSPAGVAIDAANLPALKLFVKHGYDLNPIDFFDHPIRMISGYTGRDTPEHIDMLEWILEQIEIRPGIDYTLHLLEFAESGNTRATRLLLDAGTDPNMWVYQWYSVWDRVDDAEMRELLESYGARSNFRRLIAGVVLGGLLLLGVLAYLFRAKPEKAGYSEALAPERNARKGLLYMWIGLVLFLFGSISMLLFRYGSAIGIGRADLPMFAYGVFLAIAALGIRFLTHGKKLRSKDAQTILEERKRPIFLYLRSFILDEEDAEQKITLPGGISTPINPWETGLSANFGKVGDLIGIGRPGEKLATTGAARLYVSDDEWQDKVIELVEKSEIVVWTYGATEGLRWEIKRLVNDVPPEKLVIAMPFWNQKLSKRKIIWEEARTNLNKVLPKPLPETVGHSLFITFANDWTPTWVATQPPSLGIRFAMLGFWNPLGRGVKGLLNLRGYNFPELTFGEKMSYGILAAMGWSVLLVILVMFYALIDNLMR